MARALGRLAVSLAVATLGVALSDANQETAGPPLPLKLTSWAVNMSNLATGGNRVVDITIDRWSTDAEREALAAVFREKVPDKLLDAVQDLKRVGFIRLPNTIGYDLHFAQRHPQPDGGYQVVILTDRRIGYWEGRNQPRTMDYPFTLVDIHLNARGDGEGKASVATRITYNHTKRVVELENYASEPVRLTNVRIQGK